MIDDSIEKLIVTCISNIKGQARTIKKKILTTMSELWKSGEMDSVVFPSVNVLHGEWEEWCTQYDEFAKEKYGDKYNEKLDNPYTALRELSMNYIFNTELKKILESDTSGAEKPQHIIQVVRMMENKKRGSSGMSLMSEDIEEDKCITEPKEELNINKTEKVVEDNDEELDDNRFSGEKLIEKD